MRGRTAGLVLIAALVPMWLLSPPTEGAAALSFGVIGDIPYGSTQLGEFPGRIGQINADPTVQLVFHVGDIDDPINCTTSYYRTIEGYFDDFADPLVYTPGDNEWTDCHRAVSGKDNPLNRLAAVRTIFYPTVGMTLGKAPMAVTAQTGQVENVMFSRDSLTFATVHLVGSNNDLVAWTGLGYTSPTAEQRAEVTSRTNAAVTHIRSAFSQAKANNQRAVVLLTQADMFVGRSSTYRTAFKPVVQEIATQARAFGKPVFVINGDTHVYRADKPLTQSTWLSFYGISASVPNLSRYTIEGGPAVDEWLKLTVVPSSAVLQAQRVEYS